MPFSPVVLRGHQAKKKPVEHRLSLGAKDGIRTRDPDLGKVVLYQLSYSRFCFERVDSEDQDFLCALLPIIIGKLLSLYSSPI